MITKMLQSIGEHVVGGKEEREQLIASQKPYTGKYILTIAIDTITDDLTIELEEYQQEKEPEYLRGMMGSGGSSLSPTMNISLDKVKNYKSDKDPDFVATFPETIQNRELWVKYFSTPGGKEFHKMFVKAVNIEQNIVKALKKSTLAKMDDRSYAKSYYLWIERNLSEINDRIFFYLLENWFEYRKEQKRIGLKRDYPRAIIFKSLDSSQGISLYPGEMEEFVDLYKRLLEDGSKSLQTRMACFACNQLTSDVNRPTIGIFNLDMTGFIIGFGKKNETPQFTVCNSCANHIQEGYKVLESKLKFYAFKTKNGQLGPKGQTVFHYLIPMAQDPKLLKRAVRNLEGNKAKYGESVKKSLRKRIEDINLAISKTKKGSKKELKKLKDTLKNLKTRKERSVDQIAGQADLTSIVTHIVEVDMNYLDIYFFVTDAKQNPTTKEVISTQQLNKPSILAINEAYRALVQSGMDFNFYWQSRFLPIKLFLNVMNALYMQQEMDNAELVKAYSDLTSRAFIYHLINQERKDVPRFTTAIREFLKVYLFLVHANIFRGEKNIMANKKVSKPKVVDRVEYLKREFEHPFFDSTDLKAAAGIGLYFNLMRRLQENDLGTRTLIKDTRIWMKELNRENLLKILSECNRVDFIWQDKKRSNPLFTRVRVLIEEYAKQAEWKSSPESLSLAFMLGYDSFSSIYSNEEEEEENEE